MKRAMPLTLGLFLLLTFVTPVQAAPTAEKASVEAKEAAASPKKPIAPGIRDGDWSVSGVNTLRYESWSTLLVDKSPLDKKYTLLGDRLALTFKYQKPWTTFTTTINGVKFLHLPDNASFGAASTYKANGNRENDAKAYFRTLNFVFKRIGDKGMSGTIGRFDFSNGTEWKGPNPTVEWVKSNRVSDRLVGVPNWTLFQRSMNGLILKRDNGRFHGAFSAWMPTSGTYSKQAGDIINDVKVVTLAGTFKFDAWIPRQEIQLFCYNYDDRRPIVAARADNVVTGAKQTARVSVDGIDVGIRTFGISAVGAYDLPGGVLDTMLWLAYQRGDWFNCPIAAVLLPSRPGINGRKPHGNHGCGSA